MELFRALGALAEPPSPESARLAELLELGEPPPPADYEQLFAFQLYPYASVYLGGEGKLGGEARDRVAGFWRALQLTPPDEPDHLALMLSQYGGLVDLESEGDDDGGSSRHIARKAWLWEHLLSWMPLYLSKLARTAGPFYSRWGELLTEALAEQAREMGPPERLPLQLREAPSLSDPRLTGGEAWLDELLSPVRTGFIVVADDLRRGASKMELGLRAGERRFVLEALLGQDAASTLGWLSGLAAEQARATANADPVFGPVTSFWTRRARASTTLLSELAAEASDTDAG